MGGRINPALGSRAGSQDTEYFKFITGSNLGRKNAQQHVKPALMGAILSEPSPSRGNTFIT